MNKVHRIVWNQALQMWMAVAENAKGHSKSSRSLASAKRRLNLAGLLAGVIMGSAALQMAQAAPAGGQVTSGAGSIAQSGQTTTIKQSTQNLSLNWKSFNVGTSETVNFVQPSATAIAVNKIFDTNGSQILGNLNANGQVFLINPNGVIFGAGAQVNVGGLVASTLDISSSTGSTTSFAGTGNGSVINFGKITASNGGYVALLGNHVSNQGVISAQLGTVALGAGSAVTLSFIGSNLVRMVVDQSVLNTLSENGGLLQADGGKVLMTAGAAKSLLASVVNNTGVIEARTVNQQGGTITLLGGMQNGTVNVAGTLDASAPNGGNGGFIETSAAHVAVADAAKITTAAATGAAGTWLIDPTDFTVAAAGGDITGATLSSQLGGSNITIASSSGATGSAGNVNVNDAVTWSANKLTLNAQNNININANLNGSGTASLALQYGQGAVAAGNTSSYNLNNGAQVNLPAGPNFNTLLGSDGTTTNYTVINSLGAAGSTTATDLQGINGGLSGNYAMGGNIDATTTSAWNGGAGFAPIGDGTTSAFAGKFDGLGHTISGLTINLPSQNNVGLFGYTNSGALIQNVGLIGGSVTGANYVGGLVGYTGGGTIDDSYSTADVLGKANNVGGLIGYNFATINNSYATGSVSTGGGGAGGLIGYNFATINNSYARGSVNGVSAYVGGLVGATYQGSINNSYATGSVNGYGNVGGLVGVNQYGTINSSYATGSVSGGIGYLGGLVGFNLLGSINSSYATGSVSGGTSYVGGLVGDNSGGTISNSYWNTTNNPSLIGVGVGSSSGATGLTSQQMQVASNFSGFTFTSTPGATGNSWVIVDADGTLNNASGATGATSPMLASEYSTSIVNAHQLQLMAMAPNASYTLGANINAAATAGGDVWGAASAGFTPTFAPIGNGTSPFSGTFNGLGHTISGLNIDLLSQNYVGLIGYTGTGVVIQNVGLVGGSVSSAGAYIGGLVGSNEGTINSSYATGNVTGEAGSNYLGGLIGYNRGTINSSYATGSVNGINSVTGPYYVGGLVGGNFGKINNSHATGNVQGSYVGGLVGSNHGEVSNSFATGIVGGTRAGHSIGGLVGENADGTISNSYATGLVGGGIGSYYVGGLVGENAGGSISNSYATGSIVSGIADVGGLVGYNSGSINNSYATGSASGAVRIAGLVGDNAGTVTNSFWNTTNNPSLPGVGVGNASGATGLTSAQMMQTSSFAGWNISNTGGSGDIWRIYEGHTAPLLTSFLTPLTLSDAPDKAVTYNAAVQSGETTASSLVLGSAATGTHAGFYNGYYSSQQGYDITGGNLTITPKALTVSGTTVSNKIYDGTTTASLTGGLLNGVLGSDAVSLIQAGNFATKNVGTGITVTASDSLGGAAASDYFIATQPTGLAANITPKALTVTATGVNKVYDGGLKGTVILSSSGLIAGDAVAFAYTAANFTNKNVGTGITVNVSGISDSGIDAGNYTLNNTSASTTANITPAILTVIGETARNKKYDGNTKAKLAGGKLVGVISGETVTLKESGYFVSPNIGNGITVIATDTIGGAAAKNYILVQPTGLSANITP